MQKQEHFFLELEKTIIEGHFISLTLSRNYIKSSHLKKIRVHLEVIKKEEILFFEHHYSEETKSYSFSKKEGIKKIQEFLETTFKVVTLFTSHIDYSLQMNKNGMPSLHKRVASKSNSKKIGETNYLIELGVLDINGITRKGKGDKLKQINKFVEIIGNLLERHLFFKEKESLKIVDMGAGKGYLTFALYDYLKNKKDRKCEVRGVEMRQDLIDKCNRIAANVGFNNLSFEKGYISNYFLPQTDVLIALHACDTATDDAIAKGIKAGAEMIVCAPCCHKQIRKQMKCETHLTSMLQHGIFKERMAEMVTDSIRALILEMHGYSTKVFEFISTDHTGKNVLIVGQKRVNFQPSKIHSAQIEELKKEFGIRFHYLEKLVGEN